MKNTPIQMKTQTITPALLTMYQRCRKSKPFMLVGRDAECSLHAARTILAFHEAEKAGLVRLRAEEEQKNYFDVMGREDDPRHQKEIGEIIERDGCWWTCSEWFDGEKWQIADSCGMHTGYRDPLDPFQNCYIIEEMRSALDALASFQNEQASEETEAHEMACRDIATV
jgi:hypothetical protein